MKKVISVNPLPNDKIKKIHKAAVKIEAAKLKATKEIGQHEKMLRRKKAQSAGVARRKAAMLKRQQMEAARKLREQKMKANREQGMLKRKLLADKMKKRQITKHTQNAKLQLRQQAMSQLKSGSFGGRRPSTGMGQFGLQKQAQMRMRERPTPIPSPPRRGGTRPGYGRPTPIPPPPRRGGTRLGYGSPIPEPLPPKKTKKTKTPFIGYGRPTPRRGLKRISPGRVVGDINYRPRQKPRRAPDILKDAVSRPPRRGGPRPQGGAMGPDGNMYPGGVPNRVRRKYGMPLRNERPKPDYRTLRSYGLPPRKPRKPKRPSFYRSAM